MIVERFTGKRAFVTGAGSGIGEAVARALHAEAGIHSATALQFGAVRSSN